MKAGAGAIVDVLVRVGSMLADAVKKRRKAKQESHGDEGGHPQPYPLEEARERARKRREVKL